MKAKGITYSCIGVLIFVSLGLLLCCSPSGKKASKPGEVWKDPVIGMEFVWVPGGCYEMGCGSWTSECDNDEKPVHTVCVSGFWMGRYEVTQGQWQRLMGDNPSDAKQCRNQCPVERVSWNAAVNFSRRLSQKTGHTFRLPTDAEWEYACRSGGRQEMYSGGDNVDAVASYAMKSYGSDIYPVGNKHSNGLGIYDMSGNVWEWCQDWYESDYYSRSPKDNPQGPSSGYTRVVRSGSCCAKAIGTRCANRHGVVPEYQDRCGGFRLVRVGQ